MTFNWSNIYIINLNEHEERLNQTKRELDKAGIKEYIRFPGIKYNGGATVPDRITGCRLSHINIIKEAKKQNLEYVIIFEDDIEFREDFNTYIPYVKSFTEHNPWDLFYFGGSHNKDNANRTLVSEHIYQVRRTYTTHAYMVHESIYDYYLSLIDIAKPVDDVLVDYIQKKGSSYCISPNIIFQKTGISYIQNAQRDYKWIRRT
jgi:GR25 family glycosyltransferase involved in LPS biosynthesis